MGRVGSSSSSGGAYGVSPTSQAQLHTSRHEPMPTVKMIQVVANKTQPQYSVSAYVYVRSSWDCEEGNGVRVSGDGL